MFPKEITFRTASQQLVSQRIESEISTYGKYNLFHIALCTVAKFS